MDAIRNGSGASGAEGERIEVLNAMNTLARGQEHLDGRVTQIASRLDAALIVQQQSKEGVLEQTDALSNIRDELITLRDAIASQGKAIAALESLPGHRSDLPATLAQTVANAVGREIRPVIEGGEQTATVVRQGVTEMNAITRSARTRRWQNRWIGVAASLGLVAGFVAYPLAAANLPGGSHLAGFATGASDRWMGGWALLKAQDEPLYDRMQILANLYNDNELKLEACSRTLQVTKRPQPCELTLKKPLQLKQPVPVGEMLAR